MRDAQAEGRSEVSRHGRIGRLQALTSCRQRVSDACRSSSSASRAALRSGCLARLRARITVHFDTVHRGLPYRSCLPSHSSHAPRLRRAPLPVEFFLPARRVASGGAGRARASAGLRGARHHRRVLVLGRRPRARRGEERRAAARHRQRGDARGRREARAARHRSRELRQPVATDHARPAQRARRAATRCRAPMSRRSRPASSRSGCRRIRARPADLRQTTRALAAAHWVAAVFPGRAWIAVELFARAGDPARLARCAALARAAGLPQVAAGDVHMHVRARRSLQDTLTAIRLKRPLAECGYALHPNGERHLRSRARLASIYPAELLAETVAIAQRCAFSLDELRYEYPEEIVPPGRTPASYLRQLTDEGLARRYGPATRCPPDVRELIEHELALIAELRYEPYFLTVHDIVAFARSRGILCQGRGSAANSAVCYALGITEVDPSRMSMLFERFISKERNEPPDIDVDFEHQRREEVMQYVYAKYGRDRAALAATLITYRPKSAVRDVGRALGLDLAQVDRLAGVFAWWDGREVNAGAHPRSGLRARQPGARPARRADGRADGLSAPPVAARRRLRDRARPDRADGAGRERRHGRSHRPPVGQGRSRRARPAQGRLPGTRHAVGDQALPRHGVAVPGPRADGAGHPRRGSRGLRDVPARRHHRRVPDRVARAAVDAAAVEAGVLLRPRDRGRHRAPRPDPGRDGASVPAAAPGPRARHVSERCGAGACSSARSACRSSRSR